MPTEAVLERGNGQVTLDLPVDDNIYCMQDQYHLPYTTVDEQGNTVVSVVEGAESYPSPTQNGLSVRLRVKIFKNERIEVKPVADPARYRETCLVASNHYLDYLAKKKQMNTYHQSVRAVLEEVQNSTYLTALTYSAINNSTYSAYADDTSTTAILHPFIQATQTTSNYVRWYTNNDTTAAHHIRYWQGMEDRNGVELSSARERMLTIIRDRAAPGAIIRSKSLQRTTDVREIRARQTLRRIIGEDAFQRYMIRGFMIFNGASGRTYQIFPGHIKTKVWFEKKIIEELCVVMTGNFPPTDEVIMRLLLIQDSEENFKSKANVFQASKNYTVVYAPSNIRESRPLPLPEIFAALKNRRAIGITLAA